jgi:hypothetical protein
LESKKSVTYRSELPGQEARTSRFAEPSSNALLDISSIIIIKTIARDCLTTTPGTRLQITTDVVKHAASHTAVVAFRKMQIFSSFTVRHSLILDAVDYETRRIGRRMLVSMPSRLSIIP